MTKMFHKSQMFKSQMFKRVRTECPQDNIEELFFLWSQGLYLGIRGGRVQLNGNNFDNSINRKFPLKLI